MTQGTWQPIETAPKDGTRILVFFRGGMHVAEYGPVWHPDNLKWLVREPATGLESEARTVHDISKRTWPDGMPIQGGHDGPTHWMPLPEPPSLNSETRDEK